MPATTHKQKMLEHRLGRSTRDVLNLVHELHELDEKGASLRILESLCANDR